MLKRMQVRFIAAVMSAFGLVMLALLAGILMLNDHKMRQEQEETIAWILEYHEKMQELPRSERLPIYEVLRKEGGNREFTPRFFMVHSDKEGRVKIFGNEYISSIDEKTAQEYTHEVMKRKKASGVYQDYRYVIMEKEEELVLVFLNIAGEKQFQKNLLVISALIGAGSLSAVFLLVLLFSRPAVKPYMKNVEQQKRFITDASHELKTPLASIVTSADIAAMEYPEDEWIKNIQQQTVRLTQLVNDLVTLSRLEESVPYPEKTHFSFSDLVWETAEPFQTLALAKEKSFSLEIEENLWFDGDPALCL